jgi:penicillin G amidase
MKTFLKALLTAAVLFTSVLALTVYWALYRPLPAYEGDILLPGLQQPVTVKWDPHGIPHIYAGNRQDLYYALGYIHGRDRLWQITLHQLTIRGRYAEYLGEDYIESDRFLRTLGFYHTAKNNKTLYSTDELAILEAYADGINDFATEYSGKLPIEFSLADIEPIPFTVEDAIAIPRMMAWNLNHGWKSKAVIAHIAETRSPETIKRILPESIAGELVDHIDSERLRRMADTVNSGVNSPTGYLMPLIRIDNRIKDINNWASTMAGSNAWAVDGTRTESGLPLLAGDPHLNLRAPSVWYEVHLNLNGRNVAGVTIPGNPVICIGRNDHIGWSITNLMADATDFFEEIPHPRDRGRYAADSTATEDGIYSTYLIRREIIRVKDQDELLHEVRSTRNGPLINSIFDDQFFAGRVISMSWTGNEPGNELRNGLALNWADHIQEATGQTGHHAAPALNLIYADQAGNIGHTTIGRIPVRNGSTLVLRNGWLPEQSWQGFIPENRMPGEINPPSGWLANANNRVHGDRYPYYISHFWDHPSRIQRIREVLSQDTLFSASSMKALQNDVFSQHAMNVTRYILPLLQQAADDSLIARALPYITNWDYRYDVNSTAATLIDGFVLEMSRRIAGVELDDDIYPLYMDMMHLPQLVVEEQLQKFANYSAIQDQIPDSLTQPVKNPLSASLITEAMKQTVIMLSEEFGNEPWQWRWLNPHRVTFAPALFSEAARQQDAGRTRRLIVGNTLSRGPYPAPGHGMSINNGSYRGNEPFTMNAGPSFRFIADFSRPGYYESVLPPGQSGMALSPHFDDQIDLWLQENYKRVLFTGETETDTDSEFRTLNLKPLLSE